MVDYSFELYKMKVSGGERQEVQRMTERKAKITKIIEASDGTIYISTLGNGVYVYNYDKEKWSHHTVKSDNLLSDFCYNIIETGLIIISCCPVIRDYLFILF